MRQPLGIMSSFTVSSEFIYLAILLGASVLFVSNWLSMELTAMLIVVSLALTRVLTPGQALSGFSNSATLTVAAMFILSEGLVRTGALENVTLYLARFSRGNPRRLLILLGLTIPIVSAFINNTPVVVMMVPIIISLSLQHKLSPSKLLIPISYFAILGGTISLIGTSTNILVNELSREAGNEPFRMFTFAPLGLIFSLVGGIFIVLFSDRLLPDRSGTQRGEPSLSRVYLAQFRVPRGSSLVGRAIGEAFQNVHTSPAMHRRISGLRRLTPTQGTGSEAASSDLKLLHHRHEEGPPSLGGFANETIRAGDILLISGTANNITRFKSRNEIIPHIADTGPEPLQIELDPSRAVVQAVVLSNSPLIGTPLPELASLESEQIAVMGIMMPGQTSLQAMPIRDIRSGDALLLEGSQNALATLRNLYRVIFIEGMELKGSQFQRNSIALLIMAAVILGGAFTTLPIVMLAFAGVMAMVLTGCLSTDEAFRALSPRTLMLMAGTIPLGLGMQASGVADYIVVFLMSGNLLSNTVVTVSVLYLLTAILTQLISNAAVAVLLVPIALGLAQSIGIEPTPLLMAIAYGASASFMSPTGYQTNAIVMEPGGYVYTDYMRIGVPLQILMWGLGTVFIPLIYA